MKILNPKDVKTTIQKYKEFDPATVDERINQLMLDNISSINAGKKDTFQFNPYLQSYLLIVKYKTYILFGIEKSGFKTEESAKKDAIKTLKDIQKDKVPEYSVKRVFGELNRVVSGLARVRSHRQRRGEEEL